ncbi:hypothetical protein G176_gp26 [Xanthomonas phage CP1]|uniref:Uncharacterized protein n=1 Tax=Xanthomonas phage CP1 TaxID=2994055 RepID=I7HBC6_9CAUD|nr:hypothetical protein G176_gp26 [Xanthomonas phage CP1]BAM29098.1 hypothetical protein [Xanthomonas phage CP1]
MPAGLVVYNSSNILQIDSTYRNMSLVSTATIALSGTDQGTCYVDIPRSGGTSVIAWKSNFAVSRSYGPNGDFRLSANIENRNSSIQYYIFDWPRFIAEGSGGLQVRDTSGELIFDSSMKWMKVVALVATGNASSSGTANNFAAKTYATMQASPAGSLSFNQLGGADAQGNATFVISSSATGTYSTANGMGWAGVQYYRNAQIKAQAVPAPQGGSTGVGNALLLDVSYY